MTRVILVELRCDGGDKLRCVDLSYLELCWLCQV